MTYDGLDRLTDVASPMYGTSGAHYTYDVLDNITHLVAPGRDHWYCHDENRLTNVKTGSCNGSTVIGLGYDVQGNLANRNGLVHHFDYGNRLRAVVGVESYRYDAWGRRVRAASSAGLIYSLYGREGQLLWSRDERSGQRRQYLYLQGSLIAEHTRPIGASTETITYQHTDALGSPVAKTNASRGVIQRREYEPYGKLLNAPLESGPGYTGHDTDPDTQYVYMQQRYYDPRVGRLLSRDPVTAYDSGDMRHFNVYAYAFNNPYRFSDPDGRAPGCQDCEDYVSGAATFAGRQMVDAGTERANYSSAASRLAPDDSAGRSSLKSESRARTPSAVRAVVDASRPSTAAQPGTGGRANASNPAANAAGKALKVGGKVLMVGAAAQQGYEIATSAEPARDVAGAGGMVLGGLAGGEGGAVAGAVLGGLVGGPPGAAIGAIVGGLGGAAVGGVAGEAGAEALYDASREP